ncbi:MAG: hypothetical protein LBT71_10690 [Azoarcus sp.]|jgi:hypothetical protein|nr:hypothetical protein [Azoarcus sp.]
MRYFLFFITLGVGGYQNVFALEYGVVQYNLKYLLSPEYHEINHNSLYYPGSKLGGKDKFFSLKNELELRVQWDKIIIQSTLSDKGYSNLSYINQLYYDDAVGFLNFTFGKKVISWGVGHAFRPLDVIQHENRRAINTSALIGVPLISVEKITPSDALTVVWANPFVDHDRNKNESVAFRYYLFSDNYDFHFVGQYSRKNKTETGLGATRIANENISLFGSILYAQRYSNIKNSLILTDNIYSEVDPMEIREYTDAVRANIGLQWTGNSGFGILLEAYYDGEAYSQSDWRRLDRLTKEQVASGLVSREVMAGNVAWSSAAFYQDNLVRENYFMRLSYDNANGFKSSFDLLLAPKDGGVIATIELMYEKNTQRYRLGIRHYGGKADSVFYNIPESNVSWVRFELSF